MAMEHSVSQACRPLTKRNVRSDERALGKGRDQHGGATCVKLECLKPAPPARALIELWLYLDMFHGRFIGTRSYHFSLSEGLCTRYLQQTAYDSAFLSRDLSEKEQKKVKSAKTSKIWDRAHC